MRPDRRVADPQWRHRYPGEHMKLTGTRYGRLIALEFESRDDYGRSHWLCRCDCGRSKIVRADYLRNGTTKSCGCLRKRMPPIEVAE